MNSCSGGGDKKMGLPPQLLIELPFIPHWSAYVYHTAYLKGSLNTCRSTLIISLKVME